MSNPSWPSVRNGTIDVAGDRPALEHHARPGDLERRVLHVDRRQRLVRRAVPRLLAPGRTAAAATSGRRAPPTSCPGCCAHFSTARSESTPACDAKRAHARRIVAAVRNGLVGRSRLKQSHVAPGRAAARQRVLQPLDVGRGVAGKRRRPQERHLGAVVPRDRRRSPPSRSRRSPRRRRRSRAPARSCRRASDGRPARGRSCRARAWSPAAPE